MTLDTCFVHNFVTVLSLPSDVYFSVVSYFCLVYQSIIVDTIKNISVNSPLSVGCCATSDNCIYLSATTRPTNKNCFLCNNCNNLERLSILLHIHKYKDVLSKVQYKYQSVFVSCLFLRRSTGRTLGTKIL